MSQERGLLGGWSRRRAQDFVHGLAHGFKEFCVAGSARVKEEERNNTKLTTKVRVEMVQMRATSGADFES